MNFRFSMDATSKIFNVRGWMETDARSRKIYRKSIAGVSLAGMSLLAGKHKTPQSHIPGVRGDAIVANTGEAGATRSDRGGIFSEMG